MLYKPAILLAAFCSAFLDSLIQGKMFLLIVNLLLCSFDLRGNAHLSAGRCGCVGAGGRQPNPGTLLCISVKRAPGPLLTFWRSAGGQMSHGGFPESRRLLA